jgi:hypothetical protein
VVCVKGIPARIRLVVMSPAGHETADLEPAMADRVLDWVKPGLGAIFQSDYPKVRIWPRQFSGAGFPRAFQQHVPIPEPPGQRSPWVLLAGAVHLGRQKIDLGLALYSDEPTRIRMITVEHDAWLDFLSIQPAPQTI